MTERPWKKKYRWVLTAPDLLSILLAVSRPSIWSMFPAAAMNAAVPWVALKTYGFF